MFWCRLVRGGGLEAGQERSGEVVWRLVGEGGLEAGQGKWSGRLVRGCGLEAGRGKWSGDCSRNGLEAGRARLSESSSKELVWWLVEGSGLGIPKKPKAGTLPRKKINSFFGLLPRRRSVPSRHFPSTENTITRDPDCMKTDLLDERRNRPRLNNDFWWRGVFSLNGNHNYARPKLYGNQPFG